MLFKPQFRHRRWIPLKASARVALFCQCGTAILSTVPAGTVSDGQVCLHKYLQTVMLFINNVYITLDRLDAIL